jgi:predicted nuclease of restriction endonuclease-like (RecB) superfamily
VPDKLKILEKTEKNSFSLDKDYKSLLSEIKSRLHSSQLRAAIAVNRQLIQFYWEVGRLIIERQEQTKWGDKLFDTLAKDLSHSFPDMKGFSKTNFKNMRQFASHYPQGEFSQALPDQLTWTHHVVLIQMIEKIDLPIKQWYSEQVIENGWSYRQLREQIQSQLYERQGDKTLKTTNFYDKLPLPTSALAQEMIKDPYKFHFLTVGEDAHEKEVQRGLLKHVQQFLMELGQGFALYGSNYPIHVSGKRFEIDLLMYNTKLHAYVVVEIKRKDFHPHHTGQLNFYLSTIDEQLKMPEDNPTIGLLLCEKKDRVIAEYALRGIERPMGISEYELSKSLPSKLQEILPTPEEIEAELNEFVKEDEEKQAL